MTHDDMLSLARTMRDRAYAPYSKFHVGAVVKGANGKIYGGCNVENAAYPVGNCAEASAIAAMVGDGETRIVEALVMGPEGQICTPCGACRQRLREFADLDLPIYLADPTGIQQTVTLDDLLPMSFGPDNLMQK
ncbi:cytidine deaminase [Rhizomicrobium electricum]|uniref:Cytidine deaminase n=1 Tax=Rhizomicrobium electricum TaxID=480070 RepID=A0ABN1ERB4_9PROT|nr:cytidine deaminase [Rhizomicrobium electricum]NIJ48883.1 cytidine deaminase [Rhizomicrobium electricum]